MIQKRFQNALGKLQVKLFFAAIRYLCRRSTIIRWQEQDHDAIRQGLANLASLFAALEKNVTIGHSDREQILEDFSLSLGQWSNTDNSLKLSFSQAGEDLIADYIFRCRGITNPTYLDIGAYQPFRYSNTAVFYARGSRGVVVEADPSKAQAFKLKRPEDQVIACAVGEKTGWADFHIRKGGEDALSSLETPEDLDNYMTIRVEVKKVAQILDGSFLNKGPDFLSLDVEGLDAQILMSFPFDRYRPKVICVETVTFSESGHGEKQSGIGDFLASRGYINYADTNVNTIFVDREFWELKK